MSTSARTQGLILPLLIIIAAFTVVVFLSTRLETMRPPLPAGFEDSDLTVQGKTLKGYLLGSEGLVADWYWILSLQYLGSKLVNEEQGFDLNDLTKLNPRLLYPYLDNATDLDPHFNAAYSYGAVVLPAIDPAQAIALTQKGIRNNPDNWRLYQYLGYIYWTEKEFDLAAETYEAGANIPGAPPFMRQMVASMRTKGGDRETARMIYKQMLAEAEDEQSKRNAQARLDEINSLNEREAVNKILLDARQNRGRCPDSVAEIFPALRAVALPDGDEFRIDRSNNLVDPTGVPYTLDAEKCELQLGQTSRIPRSR